MSEQATTTETTEVAATEATPEQPAKTERKKRTLQPCFCREFEAGIDTGTEDAPDVTIETTGCSQMTNRVFAQGHDAKLVSFLVAAELDGKDIRYGRDSGMVTTTDALGAASRVSEALAAKTQVALANGRKKQETKAANAEKRQQAKQDKATKGAERAAALQAKLDAKAAAKQEAARPDAAEVQVTNIEPAHVQAKVGRWEYSGTENADGSFTYDSATNGEPKTIPAGKWTRIMQDA